MELNGDVTNAISALRAVHLAPGFSRLMAFVCDEFGRGVGLAEDPPD
jgi:hypothetical protein